MPLALRAGFALLVVGLLSGAAMIARGVADTRTGHQQAAYHSTGMLKPLHGVTLHAVLVLPALAWLVSLTGVAGGAAAAGGARRGVAVRGGRAVGAARAGAR